MKYADESAEQSANLGGTAGYMSCPIVMMWGGFFIFIKSFKGSGFNEAFIKTMVRSLLNLKNQQSFFKKK